MPPSQVRQAANLLLLTLFAVATAHSEEVHIAVAANFTGPIQVIAQRFERDIGHRIVAADDETPARLIKEDSAAAGSNFTYAIDKLVLWSADPALVDAKDEILRKGGFKHLALANHTMPAFVALTILVTLPPHH